MLPSVDAGAHTHYLPCSDCRGKNVSEMGDYFSFWPHEAARTTGAGNVTVVQRKGIYDTRRVHHNTSHVDRSILYILDNLNHLQ